MGMKTKGLDQLKLKLNHIATAVPSAMSQELALVAHQVQLKAKAMAPIDYGDLKDSIQLRRLGVQGAGGRFVAGLSQYEVFINTAKAITDPEKLAEGITTVGDYAWDVHEHMGWGSVKRSLMPSEKSVDAGRAQGVEAGGRFMERSINEIAISGNITIRLAKIARNQLR